MTVTVITKAEFLDLWDQKKVYDVLVTPIAILCKKIFEVGDTPTPNGETLIVNIP